MYSTHWCHMQHSYKMSNMEKHANIGYFLITIFRAFSIFKMLENIPLQDDECSKHEHQAYSYAVELVVMHQMKAFEYSETPKQWG